MAILRDTLRRIDRMLAQLEPRVHEGDPNASGLYLRLMKQRADTAVKVKQIEARPDALLQWLARIMNKGKP